MFQFTGFPPHTYGFSIRWLAVPAGSPHSDIHGSLPVCGSPWLFAAYHVFHRLSVPRHPPCALSCLTFVVPLLNSFLLRPGSQDAFPIWRFIWFLLSLTPPGSQCSMLYASIACYCHNKFKVIPSEQLTSLSWRGFLMFLADQYFYWSYLFRYSVFKVQIQLPDDN